MGIRLLIICNQFTGTALHSSSWLQLQLLVFVLCKRVLLIISVINYTTALWAILQYIFVTHHHHFNVLLRICISLLYWYCFLNANLSCILSGWKAECFCFCIGLNNDNWLIERDIFSSVILPRPDWQTVNHTGKTAFLKYQIRVLCDDNYYNTTCTKLCRPRNDKFGHYNCDVNGDKECLEGWIGNNCQTGK